MTRFKYIHEHPDWPNLHWRRYEMTDLLASVSHQQGMLLGQMTTLGFDLRQEAELNAITENVIKTSEIEGEVLNPGEVRSSVASRLGIDIGGVAPANCDVDGIVDLMLDTSANCGKELTEERLFGWHSLLFPSSWTSAGRSPWVLGVSPIEARCASSLDSMDRSAYISSPLRRIGSNPR